MPNATKLTILELSILFVQILPVFMIRNEFVITRGGDTGHNQGDTFVIPSTLCNHTSSTYQELCQPYQANSHPDQPCVCQCFSANSTFVFQMNQWGCVTDSHVQKLQDCGEKALFTVEENPPSTKLKALSIMDGMSYPLDIPFGNPSGWQQCDLNLNTSWVFGCNGSRLQSTPYQKGMEHLFSFPVAASSNAFALEVRGDVPQQQMPVLLGKIVNLGIRCRNSTQHHYRACLIFKILGTQSCATIPLTSPVLNTYTSTSTSRVEETPAITKTKAIEETPHSIVTPAIRRTAVVTGTPAITKKSAITETSNSTGTPAITRTQATIRTAAVTGSRVLVGTPTLATTPTFTETPTSTRATTNVAASVKSLAINSLAIAIWSTSFSSQSNTLAEPIVTLSEGTTFPPEDTLNANSNSGSDSSSNQGSYSRGLMVGMSVVMVLVLFNIFGCLVYHRRRQAKRNARGNSGNNRTTMSLNQHSNPVFQWEDESGYEVLPGIAKQQSIYASIYRMPRPSFVSRNDTAETKNDSEDLQEPFYHELELFKNNGGKQVQNDGINHSDQPVYCLVEEIISSREDRKPTTHETKSVQSVLENTGGSTCSESTYSDKRLDDCKNTNEPFYCVLEGNSYPATEAMDTNDHRDKQEPVYNVLEGPQ